MMPLDRDPGPRESEKYCSYCYRDGKFTYPGNDWEGFHKHTLDAMIAGGMNPLKARILASLMRFAPRWRTR